jgi:type II secretory pathway pseudopilin PulG
MNKRSNQKGFTLLELFVVVAAIIIALLVVFFMRLEG